MSEERKIQVNDEVTLKGKVTYIGESGSADVWFQGSPDANYIHPDALRAAIPAAEEWVKGDESKYAKFGRLVVENIRNQPHWWEDEWSLEIMPLAVDAGLAEYVPYNPEVHGPGVEAEPGEEIWVWTPAPPEVK